MNLGLIRGLLWYGLLAAPAVVLAQDSLDTLAQQLIELRAEVERLDSELDILAQEHRNEMASLAAQRTDLEGSLNRLNVTLAQQRDQLDKNLEQAQAAGVDKEQLRPLLMTAIVKLDDAIAASLPFKIDERRMELNDVRQQLESGAMDPHRAVNRLWAFYEDEIRLARENAIYSQTIELSGEQILADVAKIGSVMLFFETPDQAYGYARQAASGWSFEQVTDADQIQAIQNLFDSLRKQIRQGYFQIPNALPRGA